MYRRHSERVDTNIDNFAMRSNLFVKLMPQANPVVGSLLPIPSVSIEIRLKLQSCWSFLPPLWQFYFSTPRLLQFETTDYL